MRSPILIATASIFLASRLPTVFAQTPRLSPSLANPFSVKLPIPPVKSPITAYVNSDTNTVIEFYEVKITPFTHKFFPDIPGPGASLVGYDGAEPGPTLLIPRGRETVLRVVNENTVSGAGGGNGRPSVLHLHGSYSRFPSRCDGWFKLKLTCSLI